MKKLLIGILGLTLALDLTGCRAEVLSTTCANCTTKLEQFMYHAAAKSLYDYLSYGRCTTNRMYKFNYKILYGEIDTKIRNGKEPVIFNEDDGSLAIRFFIHYETSDCTEIGKMVENNFIINVANKKSFNKWGDTSVCNTKLSPYNNCGKYGLFYIYAN